MIYLDRTRKLLIRNQELATIAALFVVYFLAAKLGLKMAFVHPSSTAVWPPTGIALAAILIFGYRVWPAIFLGAYLVNLTTAGSLVTSFGIALGNTLEGLLGAYLVIRFANGRRCFETVLDTVKFALLAALASTTVSATLGVTSLSLGGFAKWSDFKVIWTTWWLGDAVGAAIIAPLLILWIADFKVSWGWKRLGEFVLLVISLMVTGQIVFGPFLLKGMKNVPLEYWCIPFLVWSAVRFGPREAAAISVILSGLAIRGTLLGFGPFAVGSRNESLLLLQAFMGIISVMTLTLAVMSEERRQAEERIRNLAVTDALTGLSNYGKLVDVLDAEIKRFNRTGRPFSVLLMDLDGLKQINDQYGHLTGSAALRRIADILRVYCRDTDTAARYGGDEFALVMSEAGSKEAQQVAARIRERVSRDKEFPPLSLSVGAAAYPRHGSTREALLEAADRELYVMKRSVLGREERSRSTSLLHNER
jgi:diguanylate cyclase (GGDEF)-like protein